MNIFIQARDRQDQGEPGWKRFVKPPYLPVRDKVGCEGNTGMFIKDLLLVTRRSKDIPTNRPEHPHFRAKPLLLS